MPDMKKMICALAAAASLLPACHDKGEQFEVNGRIGDAADKMLYFEATTLNGIEAVDSARLDEEGGFSFRAPRPANPEFYRLRIDGQIVNLSVDSTETISVEATFPTMGTDYRVEGSDNCRVIKEISNKLTALQQEIQDIMTDKALTLGEQQRLAYERVARYKEEMKRDYILKNPAAPSAYFALFQTIGGGLLFDPVGNPDDVRYAGAVATAWEALYPDAQRTENLRNIALQGRKNTKRPVPAALEDIDPEKVTAAGIIEIELPDIDGRSRKLSGIKDKVVLLDFTAYSLPQSQERIMQMRQLYNKYAARGFEIYQVSIDPDEHYWKTACEHLPWICVRDSEGEASGYLGSYMVRRLPTYFLIDRNGDLVARDEQIKDLDAAVESLCAQ